MDLLVAENVSKSFSGHKALIDLSIQIPENSIFGLLGPNGAGKTTFIRIINQIIGPDSGSVTIDGKALNPSHISMIGYLPEERGLYRKMEVGEQALYLAQLKGLSKDDAMKKLKYWFEKFEIVGWWNKKIEELSKGMAQKIQFIVTILHEPRLLIFDEPFSGFDPINANLLKNEILELKKNGATIIFSTHNMASVEEICDNIALINKSRNILYGKVSEIKDAYKTNTFEIEYQPQNILMKDVLPEYFQILSIEEFANFKKAIIKVPHEKFTNELLEKFMNNSRIISFSEKLPSMNDIFIQKVNGANNLKS